MEQHTPRSPTPGPWVVYNNKSLQCLSDLAPKLEQKDKALRAALSIFEDEPAGYIVTEAVRQQLREALGLEE